MVTFYCDSFCKIWLIVLGQNILTFFELAPIITWLCSFVTQLTVTIILSIQIRMPECIMTCMTLFINILCIIFFLTCLHFHNLFDITRTNFIFTDGVIVNMDCKQFTFIALEIITDLFKFLVAHDHCLVLVGLFMRAFGFV